MLKRFAEMFWNQTSDCEVCRQEPAAAGNMRTQTTPAAAAVDPHSCCRKEVKAAASHKPGYFYELPVLHALSSDTKSILRRQMLRGGFLFLTVL